MIAMLGGVVLVFGATVYVDGEGTGNGDDISAGGVGEGPRYETRAEEIGLEGRANSRGEDGPVGTCADELKVEVAGRGSLRWKIFLKRSVIVKLELDAKTS